MNIPTWFKCRDIDPRNAVCISIATTGFSQNKHNIMALSFRRVRDTEPTTIYISGVDYELTVKQQPYTRISPEVYADESIQVGMAQTRLKELLGNPPFVMTYSVDKWYSKWTDHRILTVLEEWPILDILDVVRYTESAGPPIQPEVEDTIGFTEYLTRHLQGAPKAGKVEDVFSRLLTGYTKQLEIPVTEQYVNNMCDIVQHTGLFR